MFDNLIPCGTYCLNGITYIVTQCNIQRIDKFGNTEIISGLGSPQNRSLRVVWEIEVNALLRTYGIVKVR